jgi:CHAT domain-containing protein/tetratricopeptide (TPR) repeat protein
MAVAVPRQIICVAALLWAVVLVSAQQSATSDGDAEFIALRAAAQQAYEQNDWDRSVTAYQTLQTTARAKGSSLWEARGILGLARVANQRSQYSAAKGHARDALAIFERLNATDDIGDANITLGIAGYYGNDDESARAYFGQAIAAYTLSGNRRARLEARFRLGPVLKDLKEEAALYATLQPDAQDLGDKHLEGAILHSWGDTLYQQSIYRLAIEKLEAAAALFRELNDPNDLGTTYNSLGRVYRAHGQPAAALEFQLKALEIHRTLNVPRLLVQSLNAVAVGYEVNGELDQARAYYERALAEAERAGVPNFVTFMTANLGWFLVLRDIDVDRGTALLERAIAAGAADSFALRYAQLSDAYLKQGRYPESLDAVEKAIARCRGPLDCIEGRAARSRTNLALGREEAVLADNKAILADIETMHRTLAPSDAAKQDFQRTWDEVYSLTIDLHFRRREFRDALEAAELARSRAFLDLLASRERQNSPGDRRTGVSSDAGATDGATATPATELVVRGASAPASPVLSTSAAQTLRSEASAPPPTLDALTAIATRLHSTLLAYWVGGNNVYAWVLSPDGNVRGASVTIARSKLDELIRASTAFTTPAPSPAGATIATRGDMRIAVSPRSRRTWRTLYDLLIAPIERDLPRGAGARLTIVPYGPLLSVPFAALRDARGRYLVERYTIHSVPAAAVLQFTARQQRADARAGSMLLVGDPAAPPKIPGEPPLPRLAGANDEVRAIARLVPAARATVLAGRAATEPRVREALSGKAVIHFATHGIVRDSRPLASFLALGTAGDDDGQLTADKIYGLDLDANLIVLSACRSGGGVSTGDGIAALARAFFYAGTASVIVSVWDVADQPTNQLLPAFYQAWLNGADKASALRAAQLSLIRNLRAGRVKVATAAGTFVLNEDPAFWAAFVLLGEPD